MFSQGGGKRASALAGITAALCLLATAVAQPAPADHPDNSASPPPNLMEIVRKALSQDGGNFERARDYIYHRHVVEKRLDGDGRVKKTEDRAFEQFVLYGEPFERLIARDGRPLSEKEQQKEEERWEKLEKSVRYESPAEKRDRQQQRDKKRRENRAALLRELPAAFDFSFKGSEVVNGRDTWVIAATPKPGYHPGNSRAEILPHLRCTFWVDKRESQWVKAEAELIDNFNYAIFLARIYKGSRLVFEQQKVNNEVWLPKRQYVNASGRLLLMSGGVQQETTFSGYRKFRVESRIVSSQ